MEWIIPNVLCMGVFFLILIFYLYMTRNFYHWKKAGVPYLKPIPIFGNIFDMCTGKESIGQFCENVYREVTDPYIGVFILDEPCLVVRDLEIIKHILIRDFGHFTDRTLCSNNKHDKIGSSQLLILKSPLWLHVRKYISSEFSMAKIKNMIEFSRKSGELLQRYIEIVTSVDNGVIETRELCNKYSTDTITSSALGLKGDCFESNNNPFLEISRGYFNFNSTRNSIEKLCYYVAPKLVTLFGMKFIDNHTQMLLKNILTQTMKERQMRSRKRKDILDRLMKFMGERNEDGERFLDMDSLIGIASSIYSAAFESTSSTMSLGLLELALNSELQDKARKEIITVEQSFGSFSYDCLKEMKYLECVIKETLRKYPILPFLDRRCNKTYRIPNTDVILKKGDMVYISIRGIHMDDKFYPKAHIFDPDRFREDIAKERPGLAYIPFGEGPRFCLGRNFAVMNIKCGLAHILSKFRVDVCHQTEPDVKMNTLGFLMQPKEGIYLKFTRLKGY